MASLIEIYNKALIAFAEDPLNSEGTPIETANVLNAAWPVVRSKIFRAHPWNCLIARTTLSASATAPSWGFAYQYPLPQGDDYCERVLRIEDTRADWKVEGRRILTDEPGPLKVLYVKRVTDTEQYDGMLVDALAAELAAAVAYRFTTSRTVTADMRDAAKAALRDARSADGQEGRPDDILVSDLVDSRW